MLTQQNSSINETGDFSSAPKFFLCLLPIFIFMTVSWNIIGQDLGIDAAMRVPFMAGLLIFWCFADIFFKIKASKIWFCWVIYAFVNSMICGVNTNATPTLFDLIVQLFLPLLVLSASICFTILNPKNMLRLVFAALSVTCLEMAWRSGLLSNFSMLARISNANGVNANELGIYLALLLPAGIALYYQEGKKIFILLLGFIFCDLLLVFATASRTSFVLAFLGMISVFFFVDRQFVKKIFYIFIILYFLINISTYFGDILILERFKNTENELAKEDFGDSLIVKYMGDRSIYYYYGAEIFEEHPLHGVGFNNYIFYNPSSPHVCHVEVMAQLSEEGILGTILFLLFYICIGKDFYQTRKNFSSQRWGFSFTFFIGILAVNFASYTSFRPPYFVFLGYILGCQYLMKNEEQPKNPEKEAFEEKIS